MKLSIIVSPSHQYFNGPALSFIPLLCLSVRHVWFLCYLLDNLMSHIVYLLIINVTSNQLYLWNPNSPNTNLSLKEKYLDLRSCRKWGILSIEPAESVDKLPKRKGLVLTTLKWTLQKLGLPRHISVRQQPTISLVCLQLVRKLFIITSVQL